MPTGLGKQSTYIKNRNCTQNTYCINISLSMPLPFKDKVGLFFQKMPRIYLLKMCATNPADELLFVLLTDPSRYI